MAPIKPVIFEYKKKTQYMIFSNSKYFTQLNVQINGIKLVKILCTKFLSIKTDDKLIWKDHLTFINSKICKSIGYNI